MSHPFHEAVLRAFPRVEDVVRAFPGPPAPAPEPDGANAVLAPIFSTEDQEPLILFTRRAATLRRHAGELSFPGGRVDPTDAHPLAAALREAEEEVGLAPTDVRVLGHLTDMTTHYGARVSAFVGLVEGPPPTDPASIEEVEEILPVPASWLLDPARYEGRRIADMEPSRAVHYWQLPTATLWGITGELTARLLQRVWGWEPPTPPRVIETLEEFIPSRS